MEILVKARYVPVDLMDSSSIDYTGTCTYQQARIGTLALVANQSRALYNYTYGDSNNYNGSSSKVLTSTQAWIVRKSERPLNV